MAIKVTISPRSGNPKSLEIKKIKLEKGEWVKTEERVSFASIKDIEFLKQFLSVLTSIKLPVKEKYKITLSSQVDMSFLDSLLNSDQSEALIKGIRNNPNIHEDIIALQYRKNQLLLFEDMLSDDELKEQDWQKFFQDNQWIFGYGLNYIFLDSIPNGKLETVTTGSTFNTSGKRVDALMQTKAAINNFVLVEIKKHSTPLLLSAPYRGGCYPPSAELSGAVAQILKTSYEFVVQNTEYKSELKDEEGNSLNQFAYKVQPKCFVVVGNLMSIKGNDDKIKSFELYRSALNSPEILTFDELYYRANAIVETLSKKSQLQPLLD